MWSKPPAPSKPPGLDPSAPSEGPREKDANFLRKGRKHHRKGNDLGSKAKIRENIKFRPLDDDGDSTDSDTEGGHVSEGGARHFNLRPWSPGAGSAASTRSSTPTVLGESVHLHVDSGKGPYRTFTPPRLPAGPNMSDPPDYSDHEVDITSDLKSTRHDPDWVPRFLQNKVQLPKTRPDDTSTTPPPDQILPGTGQGGLSQESPRVPPERDNSPRWRAFWRDVDEKIQHRKFTN